MRKTLTILALALLTAGSLHAQSDDKKDGKVNVHQSDAISSVVNGPAKPATGKPAEGSTTTPKESGAKSEERPTPSTGAATSEPTEKPRRESASERRPEKEKSEAEKARDKERRIKEREARDAERDRRIRESEKAAGATDMSKKVMSNGRKVMGYRVQVFAGSNTRVDREKAQEAGKKIKSEMPGQPVYVHFYSPRWVCRIGNFAKEDEASNLLKKVKNLGYKSACVVKTPVIVSIKRR